MKRKEDNNSTLRGFLGAAAPLILQKINSINV